MTSPQGTCRRKFEVNAGVKAAWLDRRKGRYFIGPYSETLDVYNPPMLSLGRPP